MIAIRAIETAAAKIHSVKEHLWRRKARKEMRALIDLLQVQIGEITPQLDTEIAKLLEVNAAPSSPEALRKLKCERLIADLNAIRELLTTIQPLVLQGIQSTEFRVAIEKYLSIVTKICSYSKQLESWSCIKKEAKKLVFLLMQYCDSCPYETA